MSVRLKGTSWCPPSLRRRQLLMTCCQQHHCNNDNNINNGNSNNNGNNNNNNNNGNSNNNDNNGNIARGRTTMCPSQEGSYPLPGTQTCCHLCLGAPMVINHHQHRNPIEEEVQEMLNTDCQQMSTSALWSFGLPAMTVRSCKQ